MHGEHGRLAGARGIAATGVCKRSETTTTIGMREHGAEALEARRARHGRSSGHGEQRGRLQVGMASIGVEVE